MPVTLTAESPRSSSEALREHFVDSHPARRGSGGAAAAPGSCPPWPPCPPKAAPSVNSSPPRQHRTEGPMRAPDRAFPAEKDVLDLRAMELKSISRSGRRVHAG